jgi:putative ABC transport system substrate-binding protein
MMFGKKTLFLCVAFGATYYFFLNKKKEKGYNICITQITTHPSLDKIREGVEETLKSELKEKLNLTFQNAQGNMTLASHIAQKFVSSKPDLIIPITTPSTQTTYAAAKDTNLKIVFAAVSDAKSAQLVNCKNVTGVEDNVPAQKHLDLIKRLMPHVKKIGLMYNPSEANSVSMIKKLQEEETAYEFLEVPLLNSQSISDAVSLAVKKVDMIYIPNDNMAISNFETISRLASHYNIPIFTSDPDSIKQGALASVSVDQKEIGIQTARLALRVLKHKKISAIEQMSNFSVSINTKVAQKFNVNIPKDLIYTAFK